MFRVLSNLFKISVIYMKSLGWDLVNYEVELLKINKVSDTVFKKIMHTILILQSFKYMGL